MLTAAGVQGLRDIASEEGALLCFDEVMTGFRIAHGCAQQYFGITPDLTTMGKVIGELYTLLHTSFLDGNSFTAFLPMIDGKRCCFCLLIKIQQRHVVVSKSQVGPLQSR